MRWGWTVVAALLGCGFGAVSAEARPCGGSVACACGDTVVADTLLEADLEACPARGLRVVRGAALDCAGHVVSGLGAGDGIVVDRGQGAVVKGCIVVGFRIGLRLRGGHDNRLEGNQALDSVQYGIELAKRTAGAIVHGNLVVDSADEGIHVGSGAIGAWIEANEIIGSAAENLYLLSVEGATVSGNVLAESGAAALYIKHSSGNVFTNNVIEDRIVHLRGASNDNVFIGNHLVGAGFVLEAYEEGTTAARNPGWTAPLWNSITGGSIVGAKICFRFAGASSNQVGSVTVDGCLVTREQDRGGLGAIDNLVETIPLPASGNA